MALNAGPDCYLAETNWPLGGGRIAPWLSVTVKLIAAMFLALASAVAQISMQRPGLTGVPQGRKLTAPAQQPPVTLTADEEKRLNTVIKHMKRKDRKRLAAALQKMNPQQRQQLLASLKRQLAQTAKSKK
jgi:hypothetical protein